MHTIIPRSRHRRTAPVLISCLMVAFAAQGADDTRLDVPEPFTPEVLSDLALARNPGVEALQAAARAAEFRVAPAGALEDPLLSYSAAPDTVGGPRGLEQRIELTQPLPWPGKLGLREEAARQRAAAAVQNVGELRLRVATAAKALFGEWAYVHRALAINAHHQGLLSELRRVAETRYAVGRAGQQDALQAEVARARLQAEALTLERRRQEIRARTNGLLNRAPQAGLPPPAALPPPLSLPPLAVLEQGVLQEHPGLGQLRARVSEAQAQRDLAKKDFYPDIRVMAGYNSLWDRVDKRWSIGVGVNLPFDYGNKRSAALDAARADLLQRRWQLTDSEAELLGELEAARAAVEETAQAIELYRKRLLPLAEDNLSAARADYRAGAGSFLNVIDAEREQLRTEDALARARADYVGRLAELERWLGRPLASSHTQNQEATR